MLDSLIILLVIYLFLSFAKEKLIDPSSYMTGTMREPRGSPNLTGWNLSSLYSKRPIIVDDLAPV